MSATNQLELLNAIIENPHKDEPRLKYADWLEANGQPERAEFIRLQCLIDNGRESEDDSDREIELLQSHQEQWEAETFGRGATEIEFCRGFPESCTTTANAFITLGAEWCRRTILRRVVLSAVRGVADQLAACPHLRTLSRLEIEDDQFGDDDMIALAASPHFHSITGFSLGKASNQPSQVGDRGVRSLADARFLPSLAFLYVSVNGELSSEGLIALAQSERIAHLLELYFANTTIDDRGADILAQAKCRDLQTLFISGSRIGDAGLLSLATSPRLPNLTRLGLWRACVTPEVFRDLARSRHSSKLRKLELCGSPLSHVNPDAIGKLLAARPGLDLDLTDCSLSDEVLVELAERFPGRVSPDAECENMP